MTHGVTPKVMRNAATKGSKKFMRYVMRNSIFASAINERIETISDVRKAICEKMRYSDKRYTVSKKLIA